jgi:sugar-phosphatase
VGGTPSHRRRAAARIPRGRKASETIRAFAPAHADVAIETQRVLTWECEDTEGLVPLPGAHAILAQSALPVCIVTSCDRRLAVARLATVDLLIDTLLVSGDEVANGKPDPDPYLLGAHRVGCEIGSCLVIEDAPAGVESGRRAGATVCAVRTTHRDTQLAQAHFRTGTLADVMSDVLELAPPASPALDN